MVYQNKFVAVVKCNRKILREQGEYVTLPFGCEYSLLLKNMNSQRASVSIQIDGQEVLKNHTLIVDGNSEVEIERFIDSLSEGNRFKFIEKTNQISEHRGDKIDDGFIRIEVKYEKQIEAWTTIHNTIEYKYYEPPMWSHSRRVTDWTISTNDPGPCYMTSNSNISNNITSSNSGGVMRASCSNISASGSGEHAFYNAPELSDSRKLLIEKLAASAAEEGVTVPGSRSEQSFSLGEIGELEENSHIIIIRLRGALGVTNVKVTKPVTVKTKLKCVTCGHVSRSSAQFCNKCGTALQII